MKLVRLAAALASGALALAACSTTSTGTGTSGDGAAGSAEADAFPVTIEHALGTTTIEAEPTRVATLGWADADVALSLGVVPVGATAISWGGTDEGSTEWFDKELAEVGGTAPTRYSDADGAPVDEIAALTPDLILATNTSLTPAEYEQLSKIAPVVAYPGAPWGTSWQDSLDLGGQALGRSEKAAEIRAETEQAIAAAADKHPQIKGKSVIVASLSTTDKSKVDVYTTLDNRPKLLAELGMVNAPIVEQLSQGDSFFAAVSAEQAATLDSDIFIAYTMQPGELESLRSDPLLGQIPAFGTGGYLEASDQSAVLGMSAPSPLSIPWTMDAFVPSIAEAVDRAG